MTTQITELSDRPHGLDRFETRRTQRPRIPLPSVRLYRSERKVLLALVDVFLLNAALFVVWGLRTAQSLSPALFTEPIKWYIVLTIVWALWALVFDLYDLARSASLSAILPNITLAVLGTGLVYAFIPKLTPPLESRSTVLLFWLVAWLSLVVWRITYAKLFVQPWFQQQALVVGAGWAGRTLAEMLRTAPRDANPFRGTGYVLRGFIDDDPKLQGQVICDVPVLGNRAVLVQMAEAMEIDEIIVAITHRHAIQPELFDALLRCREMGIRITPMSLVYERLLGRVPVQHLGRDLQAALPMEDSATYRLYRGVKRVADLVIATIALIPLAVISVVVAAANALWSPGPLLYRQARVGQGGRHFQCIKFRSMVPDAEKGTGAVWATKDDDRITPVGRILRKARLDELPQVINVLRGEMSIIGPRPERPEFVEELAQTIPFYRARHAIRPGITGWAQVQYRYGNCHEDARIKLEYDLYYVRHANVFLDLKILVKTAAVMLQFKGQ